MQVDPWTLALQAVNFVVLVWLLSRFLYRPVRQVIEKRQAIAGEALARARAEAEEAAAAKARYEARLAELEAGRQAQEAALHARMSAERDQILEAARAAADKIRQDAEREAEAARARAVAAARREIAGLAAELARRILAAAGAQEPGAGARARIDAFFARLPADRLAELKADLGAAPRVVVVTAAPAPEAARAEWTAAVRRWLGDGIDAAFETDPDLLGGVVLRLPHATLDFSWATLLEEARETLGEDADGD